MQETPRGDLARSLAGVELALIRHRRTVRRRLGVSDEELTVLLYLAFEGGAPLAKLVKLTTLSRSGMGTLVQRLEEAGLVERRTDPGDRRLRLARLTPLGHERLERAYGDRDEAARRGTSRFSATELRTLELLLDALAEAAGAEGEAPDGGAAPPSSVGAPIWRRWG
jgi:DNA-binding MarR family transcriptional regulator